MWNLLRQTFPDIASEQAFLRTISLHAGTGDHRTRLPARLTG
jgi:hypothetical protein